MTNTLLVQANSLHIPLADNSVHLAVTSPPYWSLRNYEVSGQLGMERNHDCLAWARGEPPCDVCYVCSMRKVFAEVHRVLRDDGTLWLNLGDSYAGSGGAGGDYNDGGLRAGQPRFEGTSKSKRIERGPGNRWGGGNAPASGGLKPKDMACIPWRVALALQADGWWLRSEIAWVKRAPMPESARDRPTNATEKIFLLTKSPHYYYDAEAVREPGAAHQGQAGTFGRAKGKNTEYAIPHQDQTSHRPDRADRVPVGRNMRNAWILSPEPFPGKHHAVFPSEIPRRAIKAGTSQAGVCQICGAPWRRITETKPVMGSWHDHQNDLVVGQRSERNDMKGDNFYRNSLPSATLGWEPTCPCDAGDPVPATVLDVFSGAATTGLVCQQLGRRYIGLDLSPEYLRLSRERLGHTALDAWVNGKPAQATDLGPLFALED